jgi:hypothetical protein
MGYKLTETYLKGAVFASCCLLQLGSTKLKKKHAA